MKNNMKTIVFLTGAGISAESGISTFLDSNGLWNNYNVEDVASVEGWKRNPKHIFVVVGTSLEVNPAASLVMYSRAEQNYIIDPAAPKDMLEELDPTLHVYNLPATEGMKELLKELGVHVV